MSQNSRPKRMTIGSRKLSMEPKKESWVTLV